MVEIVEKVEGVPADHADGCADHADGSAKTGFRECRGGRAEYDSQGKLFWHLAKTAGWDNGRISGLLLKRWNATHWNALEADEKRAAINMMRSYARKAEKAQAAKLRQRIMILVRGAGLDLDWLHEAMVGWGYGDSLRALSFSQTVEIHAAVTALVKVPADSADRCADNADKKEKAEKAEEIKNG